ncbi:MAG TPA: AbrB/MazE/SpoVT family DNA-binding domain-containing protein [Candidatus Paceibacterota bacterium]|jgi:antitoxin component of MazEF toxin-antitoxin module|nr:AbrB/MazE/SpoVT family DNA-binding domain-containing protein [Candidatus Paceibacterota bacterium]HON22030.1 AbrB/MazE/SpoVT family DNA-binding domain-containing protein [Candidatus Paceibacterota bacterium]
MSNIKFQNRKIRKLSKVGRGKSFAVTIPIEYVRKLRWKERQKLMVELKNQSIIIKDWKK